MKCPPRQSVDQAIRALRIVTFGLIAALVAFMAMAIIAKGGIARNTDPEFGRLLLGVLAFFGISCAAGYAALYRTLVRNVEARAVELRQASDPSALVVEPYRRFAIPGAGLIEGPGFFANVVYMVTASPLALMAAALAVVLLAVHLPSHGALRRLAERAVP